MRVVLSHFGGFHRQLRSFYMVFLANFPFHWAVLSPPEGGSRIFCSISGAVAVVVDILRPSKTVFFLFITVRHFLGPVATPPGQAPSVSKVGAGVACAVARPDGVRPPSGYPEGAIDMVSAPESPFVFFKTARIYVFNGQRKNFPPSDIPKS